MKNIFSVKNIVRFFIFCLLSILFSLALLKILPVEIIFTMLEVQSSEHSFITIVIYFIYLVTWINIIIFAQELAHKIVPSQKTEAIDKN
ncbi:hypothetical protein ACRAD_28700 (plasmid) [Acinetobacter radioresistens DSM 6976 = NBRC 102413 = CIP 103788]|uniref:hypothetical protein n=1 Tax=Acinetobacter radioresistens TaxID=40216 RepID=UPI00028D40DF|nr:hypothetical protein [Acinetobacter radioresistens]BBL22199.1 hypothetical protein ACRAD_28700 [Acinetobacter radioresistens DSM 6976 = NBRC 102413 = CIP 103788]